MPAGFVVLLHGGLALLMDRDGWVGVLVPGAAERVGGPSKARFTFRIHLRLTCTSRNSGGRPTPSSPGSKLARADYSSGSRQEGLQCGRNGVLNAISGTWRPSGERV